MKTLGILFDKDGTLLDYYATWMPLNRKAALVVASGDQGLADHLMVAGGYDAATGRMRSGSTLAAGNNAEIATLWRPMLCADAPDLATMTQTINDVFESGGGEYATPVTDLNALFLRLRERGLKLGVATSDSERGAHETLGPSGAMDMLDFVAGYDSGHGVKPGPGMVHGFLAATGLAANEVMVVGDNHHDMEMGRSAGAGTIVGVLTGTSEHDDLQPHADHVIADVTRIEGLLDATERNFSPEFRQ